jgi:drug/metabolite transporter (DMT)-like permease
MPLYNFRSIFAVIIGTIFFEEKFATNKLFFIGIIFVAGIFTSLDEKFSLKSFFKITIAIGIATVFFNTLNNAFTKTVMTTNTLWTTNLWIAVLEFIFLIPTIPLFKKEIKKVNFSHLFPVGLMGLFSTVSGFAANKAFQGNLGISSIIMNIPTSMIIAFLFSIFAPSLLEKHSLKIYAIRFIAVAIMIWAAMQLTG